MEHKTDFERVRAIAALDAKRVEEKDKQYGGSWQKRGGAGAFMVTCRKWDRIEQLAALFDFNIFKAGAQDTREEGLLDDIADLRQYLLLIEERLRWEAEACEPFGGQTGVLLRGEEAVSARFPDEEGGATSGYVDQD